MAKRTKTKKQIFWDDLSNGTFAQMVRETAPGQPVKNTQMVYNIMRPLISEHRTVEVMYGIFLNAKNEILSIERLSTGTLTAAAIYPREIVKRCLDIGAAALILIHNHPSGNPAPSSEDLHMTKIVLFATKLIGTTVHDHIVIGNDTYYSFNEQGHIGRLIDEATRYLN